MRTCETCRDWDREKASHGGCKSEKFIDDSWELKEPERHPPDSLIYCNDGDWLAQTYWMTGKDFGCIHHKMKGADVKLNIRSPGDLTDFTLIAGEIEEPYMTYCSIAIKHYHELIDMDMAELIKQNRKYYKEGMTKKELAMEIIHYSHA